MPKRMIDGEGVWRSQKLRQVELDYRSEYANLLPLAEDRGSFECDSASIWADVYAYNRPDIKPEDVEKMLAEFERVKLLLRWEAGGKTWGFWVGIDKAGLLPKPSERHSDAPIPDPDMLARFTGDSPAPTPRLDRANSAPETRTGFGFGFGSGVGSGSGLGLGESNSHSAAQHGSQIPPPEEDQSHKPSQKPVAATAQSALTVLALSDKLSRMGAAYGYRAFSANDPLLPLLTSLTEERLAIYSADNEPLDKPQVEGGLTAREASASLALCSLKNAVTGLILVDQHIKISKPNPAEGMVEFSEDDIRKLMAAFGWPSMQSDDPAWRDITPNMFAAILHWSFNDSSYWPKNLHTLEDIIRCFAKMRTQYEKFFKHLPEGKKPHDFGIGWPEELDAPRLPEEPEEDDEGGMFSVEDVDDKDGLR